MRKIVLAAFFSLALISSHPTFADDSTSSSTVAPPKSEGLLSNLFNSATNAVKNVIGNAVEQGAKDAATDMVLSNPGSVTQVVRGLSGAGQKDPDLAHINKMYNSAPKDSDERKALNALYIRVRDGDPKARQEVVDRWVNFQQPKPVNPAPQPTVSTPPPAATDKPANQVQNVPPATTVPQEKPAPPTIKPVSFVDVEIPAGPAPRDNSDLGRGFGGSTLRDQLGLAENHLSNMQDLVTGYNDKIKDLQDQIRHGGDRTSLRGEIANIIGERDDTINRHLKPTQDFLNSHPNGVGSEGDSNPSFDPSQESNSENSNDPVGRDINNEMQNVEQGADNAESRGDPGNNGGGNEQPPSGGSGGHSGGSCGGMK